MDYAVEWLINVTKDEISMGDQDDTPIENHEELHSRKMHKETQPMK
jgi:hypothetical protein